MFEVIWISPNAGPLATYIELQVGVFSFPLVATYEGSSDLVDFVLQSGELPQNFQISNINNTLHGTIITEMDLYVNGWVRPEDFTYDTEDTSGGNYATYGSALAGGKTFTFTIRAFHTTLPGTFKDRTFSIHVENNYSSDRDSFVLDYFEGDKLLYNGEQELTPLQWIIKQKNDGFYD